jgi:hypothetical protein
MSACCAISTLTVRMAVAVVMAVDGVSCCIRV